MPSYSPVDFLIETFIKHNQDILPKNGEFVEPDIVATNTLNAIYKQSKNLHTLSQYFNVNKAVILNIQTTTTYKHYAIVLNTFEWQMVITICHNITTQRVHTKTYIQHTPKHTDALFNIKYMEPLNDVYNAFESKTQHDIDYTKASALHAFYRMHTELFDIRITHDQPFTFVDDTRTTQNTSFIKQICVKDFHTLSPITPFANQPYEGFSMYSQNPNDTTHRQDEVQFLFPTHTLPDYEHQAIQSKTINTITCIHMRKNNKPFYLVLHVD